MMTFARFFVWLLGILLVLWFLAARNLGLPLILVLTIIAAVVLFFAVKFLARTNVWVLAENTFRESIRKKVLVGFLIVSLLVIGGSTFLTVLSPGEELKMVKDVCASAVGIFGMLIAVFVSGSVLPSEVENRTVYTLLSKPVRRFEYLAGKFIGVQITVLLNLTLMAGLFLIMLYTREKIFSAVLVKSVFLTYFELAILSAFTFAVSSLASSPTLPIICGVFIYINGHLVEYLKNLSDHASGQSAVLEYIIKTLYWVLPNLSNYNLRNELIHLAPNDPTIHVRMVSLTTYGVLCVAVGFLITCWIFRRREL